MRRAIALTILALTISACRAQQPTESAIIDADVEIAKVTLVSGPLACACVRGGNPRAVQDCLKGSGRCDRFSEMIHMSCEPNQGECMNRLSGGRCPWDLNRNYKVVMVANSPQCA
jgi:hypothetical protein